MGQNRHAATVTSSNATPPITLPAIVPAKIFCLGAVKDVEDGSIELAEISEVNEAIGAEELEDGEEPGPELVGLPMVAEPSLKIAFFVLQQRVPSNADSQQ